jgi:hypothetical protein
MGSSSECYVLKWNEFHVSVANSFTDLRNEDEFLDVTIAIDQDHQLQAHKVILSASSPYFHSLLKRNPSQHGQHPVLVMPPNIRYSDLVAVIDFIYQGEVKIPITEFTEFISLAQMLKIKGLTEDMDKGDHTKKVKAQPPQPKLPPGTQMARRRSGPQVPQASNQQAKRPRLLGAPPMGNAPKFGPPGLQQLPPGPPPEEKDFNEDEEELDDGDVHELEDDLYNTGYEEQYEGQQFPMEQPPPNAQQPGGPGPSPSSAGQAGPPPQAGTSGSSAGLQLTGLLCPKCRIMCHGVEALKDHISNVHGLMTGPTGQPQQPQDDKKSHICHICDKGFKTAKYVQTHIKRVHKVAASDQHHQEDHAGMMLDPNLSGGMLSPPKKKGRPKKKDQLVSSSGPGSFDPTMAGRPIGQVPPAPRSTQDIPEASRPPIQQLDRNSPMRQRPAGMMSPSPSKRPIPPHGMMGQGFRPRGPIPSLLQQQMHQQGGPHQPPQPMDMKRLGMKLGGSISISSSEPALGMMSPQASPRRPMPSTSRGSGNVSSPRSDPMPSSSRPPGGSGVQRQGSVVMQSDPIIKEEPMEDDLYEEGEEEMAEDYEEGEEAYGEEEEDDDDEDGDYGQASLDAMYGTEAPYDDEADQSGNYQQ